MPVPTLQDLITLSSTAAGLQAESAEERLLTLVAMLASGKAPDGTALPGGSSAWGQSSTAKFVGSGSPVGVVTPSGEGDLYVDDTTPGLWQATGVANTNWQQIGTSGQSVVRKFPFAFDTPDILIGATLYTPTVGDILLDGWIEIDTAWNGTTPLGDVGTFNGAPSGWFAGAAFDGGAIAMTHADSSWTTGLLGAGLGGVDKAAVTLTMLSNTYMVPGSGGLAAGWRWVPAKFVTADPIKVCVTQDGTNTGADPGATQGAATLYLVTATPA